MFESIQNKYKMMMVIGAINGMRDLGVADDDILVRVMRLYGVTREYVLDLMKTETA